MHIQFFRDLLRSLSRSRQFEPCADAGDLFLGSGHKDGSILEYCWSSVDMRTYCAAGTTGLGSMGASKNGQIRLREKGAVESEECDA
jgi:hypothetical protein